jgi:putative nucleotidyltransferase with HDIG domain
MKNKVVPSGEYAISKNSDENLVAHLGTCVGVTLSDKDNGVGGLIHFLLAEPLGSAPGSQESVYASTGLPLFIKEILDAGAEVNKLIATVAGGALIGPVSLVDLNLDVGGHTADTVLTILQKHNIKIVRSETGGASGCKLQFKGDSFESEITHFDQIPIEGSDRAPKMSQKDVKDAIALVHPIPQNILKLIRMIQDGEYAMKDIANNVRQDQVLSGKVLHMCNSAYFARRSKVSSIDTALVMLGEKTFLQMMLSASLESFFNDDQHGYSLVKGGLFYHALGTALVAERIASFIGEIDPSIAYTAGLLHDIGRVVLDQFVAKYSVKFYSAANDPTVNFLEFEKEILGMDHQEVGVALGNDWSLPEDLIDVIKNHHHPSEAETQPVLCAIVYLADLFMSKFQVGLELESVNSQELTDSMKILKIEPEKLRNIIAYVPWHDVGSLLKQGFDGGTNN